MPVSAIKPKQMRSVCGQFKRNHCEVLKQLTNDILKESHLSFTTSQKNKVIKNLSMVHELDHCGICHQTCDATTLRHEMRRHPEDTNLELILNIRDANTRQMALSRQGFLASLLHKRATENIKIFGNPRGAELSRLNVFRKFLRDKILTMLDFKKS